MEGGDNIVLEERLENIVDTNDDGCDGLEVEIDLVFRVGFMFDIFRNIKNDLIDDLGEEDTYTPEEDCRKVRSQDVRPVDSTANVEESAVRCKLHK